MEWVAVCEDGCGVIPDSYAKNGQWAEAYARTHMHLHPGHRVVVGTEVRMPQESNAPA